MAQATGATRHGNCHSVVKSDKDISTVMNLLAAETLFQKELGRGLGKNAENELTDLFFQETAVLASGTLLTNYLCQVQSNWGRRVQPCEGEQQEKEQQEEKSLFDNDIGNLVKHDAATDDNKEDWLDEIYIWCNKARLSNKHLYPCSYHRICEIPDKKINLDSFCRQLSEPNGV